MIRIISLVFSLTMLVGSVQACDGCGCSISAGGVGLLTQANARYFGINYRQSLFEIGAHSDSELTKDRFQELQFVARVGISKRLLLEGSLPYRMIYRSGEETIPVEEKGIGDAKVLAHYTVMDRSNAKGNRLFWSLGSGLSAPTGKYNGVYDDRLPDHLNPGTGAWGLLLQSNISLQSGNWGLNAQFAGHLKQPNNAEYRFGNQWTNTTLVFWKKDWEKISAAPFAGIYSELLGNGQRNGIAEAPSTAGYGSFLTTGCEAKIGKINLGAQLQIPVLQEYSNGEVSSKSRLSLTLALLI